MGVVWVAAGVARRCASRIGESARRCRQRPRNEGGIKVPRRHRQTRNTGKLPKTELRSGRRTILRGECLQDHTARARTRPQSLTTPHDPATCAHITTTTAHCTPTLSSPLRARVGPNTPSETSPSLRRPPAAESPLSLLSLRARALGSQCPSTTPVEFNEPRLSCDPAVAHLHAVSAFFVGPPLPI